jgi:hypothetical protein
MRVLVVLGTVGALFASTSAFGQGVPVEPYAGTTQAAPADITDTAPAAPYVADEAPVGTNDGSVDPYSDGYWGGYPDGYDDDGATTYGDGTDPYATGEVSLSGFQAALSPYGQWVEYGTYGLVWIPAVAVVGADFVPYGCGDWELTQYGWTFDSCYAWGWAPFHYGRWISVASYGWAWIPDSTWGPAWVSWRAGGGYIGWAPLGPGNTPCAGPGTSSYGNGSWTFTNSRQFYNSGPRYIPPPKVKDVYQASQPCDHPVTVGTQTVNLGPRPAYVAYYQQTPIPRVPLSSVSAASPPPSIVARQAVTPSPPPSWTQATMAGGPVTNPIPAGTFSSPLSGAVYAGQAYTPPPIRETGGTPDFSVYVGGQRITPAPPRGYGGYGGYGGGMAGGGYSATYAPPATYRPSYQAAAPTFYGQSPPRTYTPAPTYGASYGGMAPPRTYSAPSFSTPSFGGTVAPRSYAPSGGGASFHMAAPSGFGGGRR